VAQWGVQLDRLLFAVSHAGACQAACATERTLGRVTGRLHVGTIVGPTGQGSIGQGSRPAAPLRGEKPDFWPVSKFTGSFPLRGNPAGKKHHPMKDNAYRQDLVSVY